MNWNSTKCRRYRDRLSLLAADALKGTERTEIEKHVNSCNACTTQLREFQHLVGQCERIATNLPEAIPGPDLRPRWRSAVLASSSTKDDRRNRGSRPGNTSRWLFEELPVWLTARRAAWGSLAMVWVATLLLNLSAPNAPKSTFAAASPSLSEVLLVLKESSQPRPKMHAPGQSPKSSGEQPRSERYDTQPATIGKAV